VSVHESFRRLHLTEHRYLLKDGAKRGLSKTRYFVLLPGPFLRRISEGNDMLGELRYYKHPKDSKPIGTVLLDEYSCCCCCCVVVVLFFYAARCVFVVVCMCVCVCVYVCVRVCVGEWLKSGLRVVKACSNPPRRWPIAFSWFPYPTADNTFSPPRFTSYMSLRPDALYLPCMPLSRIPKTRSIGSMRSAAVNPT